MSLETPQEKYGWTAVPRNRSNIPSDAQAGSRDFEFIFEDLWPTSDVVKKTQAYAKEHLSQETYNHSLRVYCFGHVMVTQHFPSWLQAGKDDFLETWALTCLLHDIGTTPQNRNSTSLSFEFQGGFIALQQLQAVGAPQAQAESVCEAIIRHQDPGETGTISRMGQLVQLATEFDNMGWQPYLVDKGIIEQVVKEHPRMQWSGCFASTIHAEIEAKPWCHTTALEGFAEAVSGNRLMEPYD